jgi:protein kinase A
LNGPQEVKEHVWFKTYDWDSLLNKKFKSPFIPPKEDNFDAKYTNSEWKDNNTEQMRQNSMILRRNSVQALFNGYYHDDNLAA